MSRRMSLWTTPWGKRFKRSCAKAGVLSDLRKKEYYQSPSVKRRKKSEAARKNKNKRYY